VRYLYIFSALLLFVACNTYRPLSVDTTADTEAWKTRKLPASSQDTTGDPTAGFDFLIHGDYIGSGVPLEIMQSAAPRMPQDKPYPRNKLNEGIPYFMTAFIAPNGAKVANGNCFTCHARSF